jgi:hypothetical protein
LLDVPRSELVHLAPNVPQQLALKRDGVPAGNDQVRYELVDGRTLLFDLDVAAQLTKLDVNLGETFWICLRWTALPAEAPYYDLWLSPETEMKRATEEESDLERQLAKSLALVRAKRLPADQLRSQNEQESRPQPTEQKRGPASADQAGSGGSPEAAELLSFGELLVHQANILIDAYASCLKYSRDTHPNILKAEDVRTFLVTVYIAQTQGRRGFRNHRERAA